MDEGTCSGSQIVVINECYGDRPIHRNNPDGSIHFDVSARCSYGSCIDTASDDFIYINGLLRTWREKDWHDEASFLRLNQKKCDVLLSYIEQARRKHHSKSCESAAREFLLAVKRAKFLVDESAHSKWLLKALELWECSQHFIEVRLDLFWWAHIMSLGANNPCNLVTFSVEELEENSYTEQFLKAQCDDKGTLETMVKTIIQNNVLREGDPEHQLAVLLDDRLRDQTMRHPQILTNFTFRIRTSWSLISKGLTKSGQSGVVLRFPWVYGKQFAVKMRQPNNDRVEDVFKHEFDILDKYRSPYVVGVVGYWELESWSWASSRGRGPKSVCPFLLMEAMECDLEGLITRYRDLRAGLPEGFSALETIKLMLPVAKALRFLHGKDVAHRDIKPQNIMCSNTSGDFDDAIVKLIDFGEATLNASDVPLDEIGVAGTDGYMDPTMWTMDLRTRKRKRNPEGYDLLKADVFSFAMVFVELLTWRHPWEETGIDRGRAVQEMLNRGLRPALPQLPEYASFIVECCWCADPPARPSFEDICSMLQNAKLLLHDENFFNDRAGLFCYEDGDGMERSIDDRHFLQA